MYQTGEWIMYGNTGVCKVEDIIHGDSERLACGLDRDRTYYLLKPLYQTGSIYTPTDSTKVFTRAVIQKEEANRFIDMIPQMKAEEYHADRLQELQNRDCGDLIELIMSIYVKKQNMEQQKKKLGQMDERFMKRAEELLHGELSVALGIDKEEVPAYISKRLAATSSGEEK